jgi:arylsulfatase A-like enzyme
MNINRRQFCASSLLSTISFSITGHAAADRPNIILMMSDDQGWADAGFRGHPHLKTPNLDDMAKKGITFNRFYSASPVCSPTRASCLTGRHPARIGIHGANSGNATTLSRFPIREPELTLAEALKQHGYSTGHFGKWHLGDLTGQDANTPDQHGFDEWFSTVRKVSTLDPDGYVENGKPVPPLEGDDSKHIIDKALPFIEKAVNSNTPFFTVIWFHTPHVPFITDEQHKNMYEWQSEAQQNFWGAITAMDEQIGRLRSELKTLGVAQDTMLWFCSDNGARKRGPEFPGSNLPYREGKATLYEGGVRVISLLEWPRKFNQPKTIEMSCSTSDYFPTICDYLNLQPEQEVKPLDGISLRPALERGMTMRPKPIGFIYRDRAAWIDGPYKLIMNREGDPNYELYQLDDDPSEKTNIVDEQTSHVRRMPHDLKLWMESCRRSEHGGDYSS